MCLAEPNASCINYICSFMGSKSFGSTQEVLFALHRIARIASQCNLNNGCSIRLWLFKPLEQAPPGVDEPVVDLGDLESCLQQQLVLLVLVGVRVIDVNGDPLAEDPRGVTVELLAAVLLRVRALGTVVVV